MNLKKKIRTTAYAAVLAALVTLILLLGSFFDMLDLACAAVGSLILHIAYHEIGGTYAFLIYAVASVLSFILLPMRSCSLFFVAFFGYYPLLRAFLGKHIRSRKLCLLLLALIYNAVMLALFFLFKGIFGMQGEPVFMYVLLLVSSNIFFFCFDLLMSRIMILYQYKIKKFIATTKKGKEDNRHDN